MPKGTIQSGVLQPINNCYISIPELQTSQYANSPVIIVMNNLPDISDSKSANYPTESAIGRSMPFVSYQGSEIRTISWTAHFFVCQDGDQNTIINYIRILEACVYPKSQNTGGAPYAPPPICQLRCGSLLSSPNTADVCCVLKSYSIKFDTSVPWDEETNVPYKVDIDMQFDVVYNQASLPGAEQIMTTGY